MPLKDHQPEEHQRTRSFDIHKRTPERVTDEAVSLSERGSRPRSAPRSVRSPWRTRPGMVRIGLSTARGKPASTITTTCPTAGSRAYALLWRVILALALTAFCAALFRPAPGVAGEADLFAAIRQGKAFAIMRHALAPGFSDPANFNVDDCSTQRNLSEEGRAEAIAIGKKFRRAGITVADVYSSAWCRCLETARLLGLGRVEKLAPLNSFFEASQRRDRQTRALATFLAGRESVAPLVLVTHQVNIAALTGRTTRPGETIVARLNKNGTVEVLGSID